jgi:hypothetical protein
MSRYTAKRSGLFWGTQKVDWIITNPPWSQMRRFLQQAMSVADHVVFLISLARGMRSWPVESAVACEVGNYFTGQHFRFLGFQFLI